MAETTELIALEMTREAAAKFWRALSWAAGQAEEAGQDHADWLSWGQSRLWHAASLDQAAIEEARNDA